LKPNCHVSQNDQNRFRLDRAEHCKRHKLLGGNRQARRVTAAGTLPPPRVIVIRHVSRSHLGVRKQQAAGQIARLCRLR
jgi:hypothetical protein